MSAAKPHRRALTALQKRGVYSNYECRCAVCGVRFNGVKSVFCFDHTHALCLGGGNEDENFRPLCRDCTLEKNRHDARALDKAQRMEAARSVAPAVLGLKPERDLRAEKRPSRWGSRPMQGRPFPQRREAMA